jgi:hypothetical protein
MDWSTQCFRDNHTSGHRVFFATPLVESLDLYAPFVPADKLAVWRDHLKAQIARSEAGDNNWATYRMKGEWARVKAGLIDRAAAFDVIEDCWRPIQRSRIVDTPGHLYHDLTTTPDTLAVEAIGRVNLLALIADGYDGPSAKEITDAAEAGTRTSLLTQDPSGQMPCNGRTDDHVWGDVGYQLAFDVMAERTFARGDRFLAGQYRRAAMLDLPNIDRWRRDDVPWAGSYFVTKNHFDPALRIGYQTASQYTNYNGSLMHHLAQAHLIRTSNIPEQPAPNEIGGYAFALDDHFATAFANAGGMFLQIDLKADTALSNGNNDYWSALGAVRFGRSDWDTRLGPSDGIRSGAGTGVSFAPTFQEDGKWIRLASIPDRYEGKFSVRFVHPCLVRCAVDYTPVRKSSGPSFHQEFTLTPDGILASLTRTSGAQPFGVTLPLLANDGLPLQTSFANGIARTRYKAGGDEQNFIVLNKDAALTEESTVRSTYGDLLPVRATSSDSTLHVFIYPRTPADLPADRIRDSFQLTPTGFSSDLATITDTFYAGRTAAGGESDHLDKPTVTFTKACGFLVQFTNDRITSIEADRPTQATLHNSTVNLSAFTATQIPQAHRN